MAITYLALFTSISIAAVAAWFSIAGLVTIFSASTIAIAVMASVLEVGKLVTASWLYRNWKETGILLRSYLTVSVLILMFITSMGIFGYLSKAYLDQTAPVQNNAALVAKLDNRIAREQQKITSSERIIQQLDAALDTLIEYDKISGPTGMLAVRQSQSTQRDSLNANIDNAQDTIATYETEKFNLTSQIRAIELEVGPVMYIAELFYDDAEANIDQAVRLVILIIVLVFDPLAVLLLIAANQSLMRQKAKNKSGPVKEIEPPPAPKPNSAPKTVPKAKPVAPSGQPERPVKKVPMKSESGFEAKKTAPTRKTEVNTNNNKLS